MRGVKFSTPGPLPTLTPADAGPGLAGITSQAGPGLGPTAVWASATIGDAAGLPAKAGEGAATTSGTAMTAGGLGAGGTSLKHSTKSAFAETWPEAVEAAFQMQSLTCLQFARQLLFFTSGSAQACPHRLALEQPMTHPWKFS